MFLFSAVAAKEKAANQSQNKGINIMMIIVLIKSTLSSPENVFERRFYLKRTEFTFGLISYGLKNGRGFNFC